MFYIIFFQLDSIEEKLLRGFVDSVQGFQMHQVKEIFVRRQEKRSSSPVFSSRFKFLNFICNEEHLSTIRNECIPFYENSFVNDLVDRILRKFVRKVKGQNENFSFLSFLPDLRAILLDLKDKLEGRSAPRILPEPTRTKPFQLTAPKARLVVPPMAVRLTKLPSRQKVQFETRFDFRFRKWKRCDRRRKRRTKGHEKRTRSTNNEKFINDKPWKNYKSFGRCHSIMFKPKNLCEHFNVKRKFSKPRKNRFNSIFSERIRCQNLK